MQTQTAGKMEQRVDTLDCWPNAGEASSALWYPLGWSWVRMSPKQSKFCVPPAWQNESIKPRCKLILIKESHAIFSYIWVCCLRFTTSYTGLVALRFFNLSQKPLNAFLFIWFFKLTQSEFVTCTQKDPYLKHRFYLCSHIHFWNYLLLSLARNVLNHIVRLILRVLLSNLRCFAFLKTQFPGSSSYFSSRLTAALSKFSAWGFLSSPPADSMLTCFFHFLVISRQPVSCPLLI